MWGKVNQNKLVGRRLDSGNRIRYLKEIIETIVECGFGTVTDSMFNYKPDILDLIMTNTVMQQFLISNKLPINYC